MLKLKSSYVMEGNVPVFFLILCECREDVRNIMESLKSLEEMNVQFVTRNFKGLNGALKRGNVQAHLRKMGADIAFVQETHLKNNAHKQLYRNWVGQVFNSKFKSQGTAITKQRHVQKTSFEEP